MVGYNERLVSPEKSGMARTGIYYPNEKSVKNMWNKLGKCREMKHLRKINHFSKKSEISYWQRHYDRLRCSQKRVGLQLRNMCTKYKCSYLTLIENDSA